MLARLFLMKWEILGGGEEGGTQRSVHQHRMKFEDIVSFTVDDLWWLCSICAEHRNR